MKSNVDISYLLYNQKDQVVQKRLGGPYDLSLPAIPELSFYQHKDYKYDNIGRLIQINDLIDVDCPDLPDDDLSCDLELNMIVDESKPSNCYSIIGVEINGEYFEFAESNLPQFQEPFHLTQDDDEYIAGYLTNFLQSLGHDNVQVQLTREDLGNGFWQITIIIENNDTSIESLVLQGGPNGMSECTSSCDYEFYIYGDNVADRLLITYEDGESAFLGVDYSDGIQSIISSLTESIMYIDNCIDIEDLEILVELVPLNQGIHDPNSCFEYIEACKAPGVNVPQFIYKVQILNTSINIVSISEHYYCPPDANLCSLLFEKECNMICRWEFSETCCDEEENVLFKKPTKLLTASSDLYYQKIEYEGLDISEIDYGNGCRLGLLKNEFNYDADHRLKNVQNTIFEPEYIEGRYNSSYLYDPAGNLTELSRYGVKHYNDD